MATGYYNPYECTHYVVDEYGTLTIYDGDYSIADIADCGGMSESEIKELIEEILNNLNEW